MFCTYVIMYYQLSHISFLKFFVISFIALLPEEFMWAFAGKKAEDLSAIIRGTSVSSRYNTSNISNICIYSFLIGEHTLGPWGIVVFVFEVLILAGIIATVIIVGRKALLQAEEEAVKEEEEQEDRESGIIIPPKEDELQVDFRVDVQDPEKVQSVELEESISVQFDETNQGK